MKLGAPPSKATLCLSEPARATEDPFWIAQVVSAAPLGLLVWMGLDALRYALTGPSAFERSIEIDVLYATSFVRLMAWAGAAVLTLLLCLSRAHATTAVKLRLWTVEVALVPALLVLAHWHASAVIGLP